MNGRRAPGAPGTSVFLFGTPRIERDGTTLPLAAPPRTLPLFAYLLLRRDQIVQREEVADALWPELDTDEGRASLRRHLYHLDRAFSASGIVVSVKRTKTWLELPSSAVDFLDVRAFEDAVARGDDAAAAEAYDADLLLPFEETWVAVERNRLRALAARVFERLIARARAERDTAAELRWLDRAIRLEPWREELVRAAMSARHESGDRTGALLAYRQFSDMIRHDLGAEPLPATTALFERIAEHGGVAAAPRSLPNDVTSFVGRAHELVTIDGLLRDNRLVTLTGPPGVGKTRLAIRAAAAAADRFRDGVWFVDLIPVDRPDLLEPALLDALHERGSPGEPVEGRLRERHLLIVLDNCERVADACAALVERILRAARDVRVLATSRRILGAAGEAVARIAPMSLPQAGGATAPHGDAVALFFERARAARAGLDVGALPLEVAFDVVRRLDGIPLALELAAARLRSLTLRQLAGMLDERFRVLASASPRTSHQRTLLATYDWSYALLDDAERDAFCAMSAFVGGWTAEAAAAVCFDPEVDALTALERIVALVDRSLVVAPSVESERRRYDFLESTRDYAARRLAERGSTEVLRRRHAAYYAQHYVALSDALRGARAHEAFAELDQDYGNVRVALRFMITEGHDVVAGMRLALAMSRYWTDRALAGEESALLRCALDTGQGDPLLRGDALQCLATITRNQGDYRAAFALQAKVVDIVRETNEPIAIAKAVLTLSNAARMVGEYDRALQLAHAAQADLRERDPYLLAYATTSSAVTHLSTGDLAFAERDFEAALELFDRAGALADAALVRLNLGLCAYYAGDYERAAALSEAGLQAALSIENRYNAAHGFQNLATIEIARGNAAAARRMLAEALALAAPIADRELSITCVEAAAALDARFGDGERAARLLAAAEAARLRYHAVRYPLDLGPWSALRERIAAQLGDVAFRLGLIEGSALSLEAACTLAARIARESHGTA